MTELFLIIIQFFIIYFVLSFNILIISTKKNYLEKLRFSENISFNIIIYLNFILIFSFLNINLNLIILSYFAFLAILITIYLVKFKMLSILNKNNYLYFFLILSTSLVLFFEVANNLVIGWDAQKFWIYKMLNFYNGNTITDLSNLPNAWYPYLGSLSWSFFWKISFINYEYSGRFFYVFLYLTSLFLVIDNFNLSKTNKIILFILLIIITYDYTHHSHWSMFSGFQDILVFSLVCLAIHYLYKLSILKKEFENFNIISILLICNSLLWLKHEGFVISFSLILSLLIFFNLNLKKKFFILAIFLLSLVLRFFIFDFYNLNPTHIQHQGFEFLQIQDIFKKISFERILIISKFLFLNLLMNYLVLIGFIFLFILLITKTNFKKIYYVLFLVMFNIISFSLIYLITDLDLTFMLKTGMDRIIFQISPFIFLFFLEFQSLFKLIKKY